MKIDRSLAQLFRLVNNNTQLISYERTHIREHRAILERSCIDSYLVPFSKAICSNLEQLRRLS